MSISSFRGIGVSVPTIGLLLGAYFQVPSLS